MWCFKKIPLLLTGCAVAIPAIAAVTVSVAEAAYSGQTIRTIMGASSPYIGTNLAPGQLDRYVWGDFSSLSTDTAYLSYFIPIDRRSSETTLEVSSVIYKSPLNWYVYGDTEAQVFTTTYSDGAIYEISTLSVMPSNNFGGVIVNYYDPVAVPAGGTASLRIDLAPDYVSIRNVRAKWIANGI